MPEIISGINFSYIFLKKSGLLTINDYLLQEKFEAEYQLNNTLDGYGVDIGVVKKIKSRKSSKHTEEESKDYTSMLEKIPVHMLFAGNNFLMGEDDDMLALAILPRMKITTDASKEIQLDSYLYFVPGIIHTAILLIEPIDYLDSNQSVQLLHDWEFNIQKFEYIFSNDELNRFVKRNIEGISKSKTILNVLNLVYSQMLFLKYKGKYEKSRIQKFLIEKEFRKERKLLEKKWNTWKKSGVFEKSKNILDFFQRIFYLQKVKNNLEE